MMGGWGSGRRSGFGREKVGDCCAIDINSLRKKGQLRAGWAGQLRWSDVYGQIVAVDLRADADRIHLSFGVHTDLRDRINRESIVRTVRIVRMPCRYGGSRPYFICPGINNGKTCSRRVAKLYMAGKHFLCRHCADLRYQSQSEGGLYRLLRRANKIRVRLGGEPGLGSDFPLKPRGMWWRSYEKLYAECHHAEKQAKQAIGARLTHVLGATEAAEVIGTYGLKP